MADNKEQAKERINVYIDKEVLKDFDSNVKTVEKKTRSAWIQEQMMKFNKKCEKNKEV